MGYPRDVTHDIPGRGLAATSLQARLILPRIAELLHVASICDNTLDAAAQNNRRSSDWGMVSASDVHALVMSPTRMAAGTTRYRIRRMSDPFARIVEGFACQLNG